MESSDIKPVFLISLPRSGSTLLQQLLSVTPEVCSVSEPWIMLPLAYMLKRNGTATEYQHSICQQGIEDFISQFPEGRKDYIDLVRSFAMGSYAKAIGNSKATVFIDKTPRYYLIVDFLAETFPGAKFIFLFRNPLDVVSSIFRSWQKNRFGPNLRGNHVDLVEGPRLLVAGYQTVKNRGYAVKYEQLVSNPQLVLPQLCQFLEIEYSSEILTAYREVPLKGRLGDSIGINHYDKISNESVGKWKYFITSHYRRWYMKRYIHAMGNDLLSAYNLDREQLMESISKIPVNWSGNLFDAVGDGAFWISLLLNRMMLRSGNRLIPAEKPLLPWG